MSFSNFFVSTTVMTPFLSVIVSLRYMNILALFSVPTIAFSVPYFMMGGNCTVSCYLCEQIFMEKKTVPLQAWTGPEGSRKLRFPDFVTTAQNGGRLSPYAPAAFTPKKYSWYSFLLEAESTPGP